MVAPRRSGFFSHSYFLPVRAWRSRTWFQRSSSTAIAGSRPTPFAPACSPSRATFTIRRRWNATSTPCGTPDISTICASSASRLAKGWIIHVYVKEKPTIREIKYTGLEFGFAERRSRQVQGTEGRPDAGKPVRSDQGEARRSGDQAIAGRARPPVRHRALGSAAHSSGRRGADVRREGRSQGQSRQDQVRRQQGAQQSRTAERDEEPEAHRHPALHLPGEPVRAHLRLHQADGRRRARALLLPDQGLLQGAGRRSQDPDPRHQRRQVVLPVQVVARQGRRYHHAGGRRPALPSEGDHLHRQQGGDEHARRCARCSRSKTATSSTPRPSAKVWRRCAKPTPRWATSTSLLFRTPRPTTRSGPSACASIWTKASSSTSAASSSRATPPRATRSFAANWRWKKARSTTAICGSSACCA